MEKLDMQVIHVLKILLKNIDKRNKKKKNNNKMLNNNNHKFNKL